MTTDDPAAPRTILPAWLRAMRPKQWVKNVLVFAAPLAAGRLFDLPVLTHVLWAFVAFCLVSASIYLINDIRDADADRAHPVKRFRPIAARQLSPRAAGGMAVVCAVASFALSWWVAPMLLVVVAVYWLLQVGYSLWWKRQPLIDLVMVSAGFLLRSIAGGVAPGIVLSQWFLLVAAFGSLFMVAGKRYSELRTLGSQAGTRPSLERYSDSFLRMVWMVSLAVVIVFYSLWAFEQHNAPLWGVPWAALSIIPFTVALLRYAMTIDAENAGAPEDVVLSDHVLQTLGVAWVILIAVGVFA